MSKARSPFGTLAAIGLGLAGLVAALHWYDTKRLREQVEVLKEDLCASLGTEQTVEILDRVASSNFPVDGPAEPDLASVERLRETMRSYRHTGWRLNCIAYFGSGGRWWHLRSYWDENLREIDRAPTEIVDMTTATCSVRPGSSRNDVKVVMRFQDGEVETAIVVRARRDH